MMDLLCSEVEGSGVRPSLRVGPKAALFLQNFHFEELLLATYDFDLMCLLPILVPGVGIDRAESSHPSEIQ